jgi:hypothetical protein
VHAYETVRHANRHNLFRSFSFRSVLSTIFFDIWPIQTLSAGNVQSDEDNNLEEKEQTRETT